MNTKKNNTTIRAIFSVLAAFIVLSCALFNDYGRGAPTLPETSAEGIPTSASDAVQDTTTTTASTTTSAQTTDPMQDEQMMESFQGIIDLPPESYDIQPQTLTEMGQLTVNADIVNVRTDANGSAPLLATIRAGEKYTVYGQKTSPTGILWLLIKTGDKVGYVSSSYVTYDGKLMGAKAYLTFDDGPSHNTKKILDILDQSGVKATFFVIYHKDSEELYKDIVKRGHTLALHSYTHDYGNIYKSEQAFFTDLDKLSNYLGGITGVYPKIMRFPGGSSNSISKRHNKGIMTRLTASVVQKGYRYFDWNVDSGDAEDTTVDKDKILGNIKSRLGNHTCAVILMHDSSTKTTTVEALPEIINMLREKGYELLPITADTPDVHHTVYN